MNDLDVKLNTKVIFKNLDVEINCFLCSFFLPPCPRQPLFFPSPALAPTWPFRPLSVVVTAASAWLPSLPSPPPGLVASQKKIF